MVVLDDNSELEEGGVRVRTNTQDTMLPNAKEIADQELTLCHSDHGALLRERLGRVTSTLAS